MFPAATFLLSIQLFSHPLLVSARFSSARVQAKMPDMAGGAAINTIQPDNLHLLRDDNDDDDKPETTLWHGLGDDANLDCNDDDISGDAAVTCEDVAWWACCHGDDDELFDSASHNEPATGWGTFRIYSDLEVDSCQTLIKGTMTESCLAGGEQGFTVSGAMLTPSLPDIIGGTTSDGITEGPTTSISPNSSNNGASSNATTNPATDTDLTGRGGPETATGIREKNKPQTQPPEKRGKPHRATLYTVRLPGKFGSQYHIPIDSNLGEEYRKLGKNLKAMTEFMVKHGREVPAPPNGWPRKIRPAR